MEVLHEDRYPVSRYLYFLRLPVGGSHYTSPPTRRRS